MTQSPQRWPAFSNIKQYLCPYGMMVSESESALLSRNTNQKTDKNMNI